MAKRRRGIREVRKKTEESREDEMKEEMEGMGEELEDRENSWN